MTNGAIVSRTHVLVVEGDPDVRAIYEGALRSAGYDVVTVGTIEDAWRSVHERRPDLVVLGRRWPDGSGVDLLGRWRTLMEKVPIIVLTARSSGDEVDAASRAGADAFVVEPCSGEALAACLGRMLRGSGSTP